VSVAGASGNPGESLSESGKNTGMSRRKYAAIVVSRMDPESMYGMIPRMFVVEGTTHDHLLAGYPIASNREAVIASRVSIEHATTLGMSRREHIQRKAAPTWEVSAWVGTLKQKPLATVLHEYSLTLNPLNP
jgi:hypothetical protein